MSKSNIKQTQTTIRDSKSGRYVTVKGVGALKGKMTISKKVDLTKPILSNPTKGTWKPKDNVLPSKRAVGDAVNH
jgi:hypothetical protein